jgi:hypothetical protein
LGYWRTVNPARAHDVIRVALYISIVLGRVLDKCRRTTVGDKAALERDRRNQGRARLTSAAANAICRALPIRIV